MEDSEKIKKDLFSDISELKNRIEELEDALVECKLSEDSLKKSEKNLLSLRSLSPTSAGSWLPLSNCPGPIIIKKQSQLQNHFSGV